MGTSNYWIITYLYIPITLWIVLMLVLFIYLLRKYTFGNWTKEKPNPYSLETFGMPRGIFRGIITLTLLYVVILFEIVNITLGGFEKEIDGLMTAFQMMIAFYFGSKVMHHFASVDKNKTKAIAASLNNSKEENSTTFFDSNAKG